MLKFSYEPRFALLTVQKINFVPKMSQHTLLRVEIRGIFGGHPSRGFLLPGEGQKIGARGFLRDRRRREKVLNTFLGFFLKFVNENVIKSGFEVVLVEISRKFRKNAHFGGGGGGITSTNGQKF